MTSVVEPITMMQARESNQDSNRMQPQVGAQQQLDKSSAIVSPPLASPTGARDSIIRKNQASAEQENADRAEEDPGINDYSKILDLQAIDKIVAFYK